MLKNHILVRWDQSKIDQNPFCHIIYVLHFRPMNNEVPDVQRMILRYPFDNV